MDPWQLWEAFVMAASLAAGTVDRWQGVFRKLKADFPSRGAGTITNDEAQAWLTGLVGEERTANTVKAVWVSACRRVFGWAVKNKHIAANPFATVTLDKPKRITKRPKWFTQAELALILKASLEYTDPQTATERARRWVPWLLAYSGARAGENVLALGTTDPRFCFAAAPSNTNNLFIGYKNGKISREANNTETDYTLVGYTPSVVDAYWTSTVLASVVYANRSDRARWYLRLSDTLCVLFIVSSSSYH
jgi:site-specific recombinase XerD